MARQNIGLGRRFSGRKRTAAPLTWNRIAEGPDGGPIYVRPAPGRTYTRETWPPRGRGRGESLTSPRRIAAKFRALEVFRLRTAGYTWQQIARQLGYRDASGPYRAYKRALDRLNWDERQR